MRKCKPMIEYFNEDCMVGMARYPDKHFDLAIVDPPYGIGAGSVKFINGTSKSEKPYYRQDDWDTKPPSKEYFDKLKRVSKNQIIWGGNYFAEHLGNFRCFIFWDKGRRNFSYADGELAWTSFDKVARYYRKNIAEVTSDGRFHPTQKPIALYKWLLQNYAKEGDKILDTHVGSASSLIACYDMGFDAVGFELDADYYKESKSRLEAFMAQQRIEMP